MVGLRTKQKPGKKHEVKYDSHSHLELRKSCRSFSGRTTHSCMCCRCTWPTWWWGWGARERRWSGACRWSASPGRTSTRCQSLAEVVELFSLIKLYVHTGLLGRGWEMWLSQVYTVCVIPKFVMFCFVFFLRFRLPIGLHSSCSMCPTADGTCQKWFTKYHDWVEWHML